MTVNSLQLPHLQIEESTFQGPSTGDYTSFSNHPSPTSDLSTQSLLHYSSPSFDHCDSPNDPPSSAFPSGASSALTSDSEPLPASSTKASKQTGLGDFFSKIPAEELHTRWRKRKRDNEEKYREEHEERKRKANQDALQKKNLRREQTELHKVNDGKSSRRSRVNQRIILDKIPP